MVAFATQVKRRRGTTAQNDAFTGAEGEIVVDTERHELRVHDGVTQGGHIIPTNETLDFANKALDNLSQEGEARFSEKATKNMDNITPTGKETVVSWGMPDYSAVVSMTSGSSAPKNGWAVACGSNANVTYSVNGVAVAQGNFWSGKWSGNWNLQIMVSAGDVVTGGSWSFIPCKGVN